MAHFGVLSYRGRGHLNPLMALSKELTARGHRVTFFQHAELEDVIRRHEIEFYPIDAPHASKGTKPRTKLGEICAALDRIGADMEGFLHEYPRALQAAGVDTLIMGEISLSGPTVAELLRLPYFIVSTSIPHNFGWDAPRSIRHPGSWLDRLQRAVLEVSILRMRGPVRLRLDRYRRRLGLKSISFIGRSYPELAHITQWPQCLGLLHEVLPKNFFYTAPFVDEMAREHIPFPWDRLGERCLVYASLGTTRKGDPELFPRIAQACHSLDMQLVISFGGRRDASELAQLPGDPIVVGNAPQLEVLQRADIVITHAGPNTVLEALMQGKPMVALPMTLDQPAVAARLRGLGVAEVLPLERRSADAVRDSLVKIRDDRSYRDAARRLQKLMQSFRGPALAADIVEERLRLHASRVTDDLSVTSQ